MRHFFILILLFITVGTNAQQKEYTIKGQVIDSSNGEPMPGVYVTTSSKGGQTNKDGYYEINGVKKGTHTLSTMYYVTHSMEQIEVNINKDTIINFNLKEKAFELDEVVITGTRTEKKLSEAPVLTTLIKSRDIQKAGATSAMEALFDNVPGIVSSPNAMGNNLRIKGLNSRYILFLVDGERMVSEGAGGNVNLDQIDVNNIERIEIINGAASALYGSNAVGAVINIITKNPIHKFEGEANIITESYNTLKTKLSFGTNTKKFISRASGFYNRSDGFGGDGDGAYAAAYMDAGANFKTTYKHSEFTRFSATGRYFRHEAFNPEGSLSTAHPLTHTISAGANMSSTSKNKKNSLIISSNYTNYIDTEYLEQLYKSNTDNKSSYLSSRVVNTYKPSEKWEIVGGLEHNFENIYSTSTLGTTPTSKNLQDYNVFGQAQYIPIKNFDIIVGTRYTYNEEYNSAFTPKLSLMYKINDFTFRGGIGTAFRAPSIKELYYDFDHQGMFWVYGNPDLQAEKGLYNSLSSEYTKGLFNFSISGYWNNINDKISQYDIINEHGGLEKYYKNVSSATLRGADINISYIIKQIVFKASYSFCDAIDNSTGLQLDSNVKHSGTSSVTWNGKFSRSPFSLQVLGRFTSPKLYQQIVLNNDGTTSENLEESNPYYIWKIAFIKPFRVNKHTFELTLKCDNIFNFQEASYINPGRQYLIGIRYAFK